MIKLADVVCCFCIRSVATSNGERISIRSNRSARSCYVNFCVSSWSSLSDGMFKTDRVIFTSEFQCVTLNA